MKRLTAFLGMLLFLVGICSAQGWLSGYSHRIELTVQGTNLDSNVSHFYLLVEFVSTAIDDQAQADGDDIRFTQSDGTTELNRHLLYYAEDVPGAGQCTGVFRVSDAGWTLESDGSTVFYLYCGNAGAPDPNTTLGVYDDSVKIYYPMDDASGQIDDATTNHNSTDESLTAYQNTGAVHYCLEMDGTNDYIQIADHADWDTSEITVSFWMNADEWGTSHFWWVDCFDTDGGDGGTDDGFNFVKTGFGGSDHRTDFNVYEDDATGDARSNSGTLNPENAWYHVAATLDSSGVARSYADGVEGSDTYDMGGSPTWTISDTFNIGQRNNGTTRFDGEFDEFFYEHTQRSVGWLKFHHANMAESDNEISPETDWNTLEEAPTGGWKPRITIIKGLFLCIALAAFVRMRRA